MPNYTTNYNLEKPLGTENYDVEVQNRNMDAIDAELAKKEDAANKGQPDGYASLDSLGKVPVAQVPSPAEMGAETPLGAQNKANQAEANANEYTDQQVASINLTADNVTIADTSNNFTADNVEGALDELFTNVSNGKISIASAITDMGQTASGSDTFAVLSAKIKDISKDAIAIVGDVLSGKTAYSGGVKITGSMPNKGAYNILPGAANKPIPAGYHNGNGYVMGDPDLIAANIVAGKNIFGVDGSFDGKKWATGTGNFYNSGKSLVIRGLAFTPSLVIWYFIPPMYTTDHDQGLGIHTKAADALYQNYTGVDSIGYIDHTKLNNINGNLVIDWFDDGFDIGGNIVYYTNQNQARWYAFE